MHENTLSFVPDHATRKTDDSHDNLAIIRFEGKFEALSLEMTLKTF